MWAQPPGGFTPQQRNRRTLRRLQVTALALVVFASVLSTTRLALVRSAPVSHQEAVETYRMRAAGQPDDFERDRVRHGASRRRKISSQTSRTPSGQAPMAARSIRTAESNGRAGSPPREASRRKEQAAAHRPFEGVYTWSIQGYEQASGGMRRELPKRSHRIVTHAPDNGWVEHHIFSEQREAWFELEWAGSGLTTQAVRNRVEFGPVEVDRTVTFSPSVLGARLPLEVNDEWSGSWKGRTEGDYTARIFEHTTITIDDERVEVWGAEIEMHMRGEVEGDVLTQSWIAPDHGLVVKQHQVMSVESGPGSYETEWSGQVQSLRPSS